MADMRDQIENALKLHEAGKLSRQFAIVTRLLKDLAAENQELRQANALQAAINENIVADHTKVYEENQQIKDWCGTDVDFELEQREEIQKLKTENQRYKEALELTEEVSENIADYVCGHIQQMYPDAWELIGASAKRSIKGSITNAWNFHVKQIEAKQALKGE